MAEALITPEQEAPYNTRDITRILAASFRHSRGNAGLQHDIFNFIASNYGNRITAQVLSATLPSFVDIAGDYIYGSGQHPPLGPSFEFGSSSRDIKTEVLKQGAAFELYLTGDKDPRSSTHTVQAMIASDHIQIPHKRIGEDNPWYYAMQPAKYKSNFVNYGLLKRRTGLDEFDAFYTTVIDEYWDMVDQGDIEERYKNQLQTVVATHLSYNPRDVSLLASAVAQ